jgi:hypothetical protein
VTGEIEVKLLVEVAMVVLTALAGLIVARWLKNHTVNPPQVQVTGSTGSQVVGSEHVQIVDNSRHITVHDHFELSGDPFPFTSKGSATMDPFEDDREVDWNDPERKKKKK